MSISIVDIPVSQLEPNPHNPRRDVGDVRELADSIRAQGIKQELLVTPSGDRDGRPMYRVVIGHRRLAAAKIAGLDMVPCRVEECVLSSCYRPVWREFSFRKSGRF